MQAAYHTSVLKERTTALQRFGHVQQIQHVHYYLSLELFHIG